MMQGQGSAAPQPGEAFAQFLSQWPGYAATSAIDALRRAEYGRLDANGQTYLDYTGGGLYARSQVREHAALLESSVFGNPHSSNPSSLAMTDLVERSRDRVLEHFGAPPEEYVAIFTPNASGALKHVGESYPFAPGGRYTLTFDNHNSVNGIREFARAKGATVTYVPLARPELRLDRAALHAALAQAEPGRSNLFAYPAQSNFSGVRHPLELIDEAHAAGWDVLLDAAAFVPTCHLDLSRWKPDFVCVSFYKMFGYPTGVGCLIARREALGRLRRPWFAGGTVRIASVQGQGHYLADDVAAFEDGTVDYLSLPAVEIGLRHLDAVGLSRIAERVRCLTGWLLQRLGGLRHGNGQPLARVHGPTGVEARGGTIAFNLLDTVGESFDIRRLEELAGAGGISLRTGCFCNPGAGEVAFGLGAGELAPVFASGQGMSFDELRSCVRLAHGKEIGAVRVSPGLASTFEDVERFLAFVETFRDRTAAEVGRSTASVGCGALARDAA